MDQIVDGGSGPLRTKRYLADIGGGRYDEILDVSAPPRN